MKRPPRRLLILVGALVIWSVILMMGLQAFAQTPPLQGQTIVAQGQLRAAPIVLRDQRGHVTSLAALRERVVVITFLDSRCREECPVMGREMAAVQRLLDRTTPWTLLVVSVAPTDDTPANIAGFAKESRWEGDWRWLTGSPAQLQAVWRAYGIFVKPTPTDVVHTPAVYVVDTTGSVRVVDMSPLSSADLARSIRVLAPRPGGNWPAWLPHL